MKRNLGLFVASLLFLAPALPAQIFIEPAPPGNVQALTMTGNIVPGSSVTVNLSGPPYWMAFVAFATQPDYFAFPEGIVLLGSENLDFGVGYLDGQGLLSQTVPNLPFRQVGDTFYAQGAVMSPQGVLALSNRVTGVYQGQLNNLMIQPLGTFQADIGSTLHFTVTTTGGQGTPVLSVLSPMPLPPNMAFNAVTGEFSFSPDLTQVGTFNVYFSATDNVESTCKQATITVGPPPPGVPTSISGHVHDAGMLFPIQNVTVTVPGGTPSTVTASDGSFLLSGIPSGNVTIVFNGQTAGDYPYLPEPMTMIAGVNNVIERPVYLPFLFSQFGVSYDPSNPVPTPVTSPMAPDIALTVMPNSVTTPQNQPFTGYINIAPVPPENAPLGLPEGVMPNRLISIQPGGVRFSPPAQITWPNEDNYPPGTVLDIFSVNENTGQFEDVGDATVQADGTIQTTSGGVVLASWHYVLPPAIDGTTAPEMTGSCPSMQITNSSTETATGFLHETYSTPTYRTAGEDRFVTLHYNSGTVDTRSLLQIDAIILAISAVPMTMSARAKVGGVHGSRSYINTSYLPGNLSQTVRVAAQLPLYGATTGVYDYKLELANHFAASSVSRIINGRAPIVNRQASEVGTGWAVEEIDRLYPQADGSVLLVRGDGTALIYGVGAQGQSGLLMQMYNAPMPFAVVTNQFAGLTPGNFTVSTASVTGQLVSSYVVPVVNFNHQPFASAAFYDLGPNGVVDGSWDPLESTCRHASLSIL